MRGRKNVLFRCDYSVKIGSGHFYRCLSLAEKLHKLNFKTTFLMKDLGIKPPREVLSKFLNYHFIPKDLSEEKDAKHTKALAGKLKADLVVLDNYKLSIDWEKQVYSNYKLLVIDDLQRRHNCDFLLDNNYYGKINPYTSLCNADCRFLLGPDFSLLRESFVSARRKVNKEDKKSFKKLLVFFGSTDPSGETLKFIKQTSTYSGGLSITVVLANGLKNKNQILKSKKSTRITFVDSPSMPETIRSHDFYFGSSGTITWERMYLGLPGVLVTVADNQVRNAKALAEDHHAIYYDKATSVNYSDALHFVELTSKQTKVLNKQRSDNLNLVDTIKRRTILEILKHES